ncbi:MAG: rRNA maturation RNase YbeY [Spirochaetaceae bacterium]|nr:rRNA maturation RNase YbeY [Spirochaetaceae bacterium]
MDFFAEECKNQVFVSVHEEFQVPEWIDKIRPYILKVLDMLEFANWELSVMFCGDSFIRELNEKYRNVEGATDVLSFEQGEKYIDESEREWFSAGDIVVSVDTLQRNAQEFNVSADEELKRLLLHGVLHLAGYDHSDNSPEQQMLKMQESVLSKLLNETDTIINA